MAVFDLFSSRQKRLRGEVNDVYTYTDLPNPFRVQVVHIWLDVIGDPNLYRNRETVRGAYQSLVDAIRRERGVFVLPPRKSYEDKGYNEELANYFLCELNTEFALDVVELSFRLIKLFTSKWDYLYRQDAEQLASNAVNELNQRFKQHGIGYQFVDNELIRVDSQFAHAEIVKPALCLMNQKKYSGAQDEFLQAYDCYRHGNHKDALVNALKAIESVMKVICEKRKWPYSPSDTCSKLVGICFEKGLVPVFWQNEFNGLRVILEGGVPTGRNKLGGHGQGEERKDVPEYIVAYVLHMTASAIVFLVEAEKNFAPVKESH